MRKEKHISSFQITPKTFWIQHSSQITVFIFMWKNWLKIGTLKLVQEQPKGVIRKRCSENMQYTYRRTPMSKCNFFEVTKKGMGCSLVNLLHVFRKTSLQNSSGRLLPLVLQKLFQKLSRLQIWAKYPSDSNIELPDIFYHMGCMRRFLENGPRRTLICHSKNVNKQYIFKMKILRLYITTRGRTTNRMKY